MQMRCHTGGGAARSWLSHRALSPPCPPGLPRPQAPRWAQGFTTPEEHCSQHSAAGPAPLLMHMQPYSGLYSHSQTHQQQTLTTSKGTMRNGSLPPPFTVSTTGPEQNTRLITVHSHTQALTHMPVAAKDLQQFLSTLCAGIQKICCPLSATSGLASNSEHATNTYHNKECVTFGGVFFSSTSRACNTRLEKRGPIGT